MPAVMVQGTGSGVGKSLLVAGLCRAARRRGINVAPFKPQNMSNNAAVTADGGEIGRAQALQARAAGLVAHSDMNPVLLKPHSATGAQLVVQGQVRGDLMARDYARRRDGLLAAVMESYCRLQSRHDLIIVEGAGSPAEINLRAGDIANMGFARAAGVPVVLAGDIDRGGVIAQIVGTKAVLDPSDAAMIRGFVINRFRGDVRLFDAGYDAIAAQTGWRGYGVVPWFDAAWRLPAEDGQDLFAPTPARAQAQGGRLRIAVLTWPGIANFDDLDPLRAEPGVELVWLRAGMVLPGDVALVILPGSKAVRADLAFLRAEGWDIDLAAHLRRGGHVLGLCGGYQMLGRSIDDPMGAEGASGKSAGLGFLDIDTTLGPHKRLAQVTGQHRATGQPIGGYEIHLGQSDGPDRARPFAHVAGRGEGAVSPSGQVAGSYLHGLFQSDAFRAAYLAGLGGRPSDHRHSDGIDRTLDALADHLEAHLDVAGILSLAAPGGAA